MKKIIYILICIILSSFAYSLQLECDDVDLVAYWNFDEASGNLIDQKCNSHPKLSLVPSGDPTYQQTKVPKNFSTYSIALDSDDNFYNDSVSAKDYMNSLGGSFTVVAWATGQTGAEQSYVSNSHDGPHGGWELTSHSAVGVLFRINQVGGQDACVAYQQAGYFAGDGSMMVGVLNATHIEAWRNTTLLQSTTCGLVPDVNAEKFGIGARYFGVAWDKFANGDIDEVSIWNRSLKPDEIRALYSSGIQAVSGGVPEAPSNPTYEYPTPITGANNNTNVTINCSTTSTGTDLKFFLSFADSQYFFNATGNGTNHLVWSTNLTDNSFTYPVTYSCSVQNITNGLFSSNVTRTLTIDTVAPSWVPFANNNFKTDNSTIISTFKHNLTLNISFQDNNLYKISLNVSDPNNFTIFYINKTITTNTSYNISTVVNITKYAVNDDIRIILKASDSHTITQIKDYSIIKDSKYLLFNTAEGTQIKVETLDTTKISKLDTQKLTDRYVFEAEYKEVIGTARFRVTSDKPIDYLKDSEFPAHMVTGGNWLDFHEFNVDKKDIIVTKVTDYIYDVTLNNVDSKTLSFNSIGGLNTYEAHYKVKVGGYIDVWVVDGGTALNINATITANGTSKDTKLGVNPATFENITISPLVAVANSTGYQNKTQQLAFSKYLNITMSLGLLGAVEIAFYDEITDSLIDSVTINVGIIHDNFSENYSTATGSVYVTGLPSGLLTIRYVAPSYYERFYYSNFSNTTTDNFTLYMVNSSVASEIGVTVYDDINQLVEGAYIQALRYDIDTNNYKLVEVAKSNWEGSTTLHLIEDSEFYRFFIYYPFGTLKDTTTPTYIYETAINFQILLSDAIAESFYKYKDVVYTLDYNNASRNFRLIYSDTQANVINTKMDVYRVNAKGETLINTSSLIGASGTILIRVPNVNDTTYEAKTFIYYGSDPEYLDSIIHSNPSYTDSSKMGLFGILLLTIIFIFVGYWSLGVACVLAPIPALLGSLYGIIAIPLGIVIVLEILGIIMAVVLNRAG